MILMVPLVLLITSVSTGEGPSCPDQKTVGGICYKRDINAVDTSHYGCTANCTYKKVKNSDSDERFCFRNGDLPVTDTCTAPSPETSDPENLEQNNLDMTIGGLSKSEFWQLRTETKLSYFQNLCWFEKKFLVLKKFCNFTDISTKETCLFLIDKGMTDTQRLNILAYDAPIRDLYHGESCNSTCEDLRNEVFRMQEVIVDRASHVSSNLSRRRLRMDQFRKKEVKGDKKASGLNVENLGKAATGLGETLGLIQNLDKADGDAKKIAIALTGFVSAIGPLFPPPGGPAAAAIAGTIGMFLNMGTESPDERLARLIGELGDKIEEEHIKTRQKIHTEIRDQTRELQAGFSSLGNKMRDNTYELGQEIKQQTQSIIEKLSDQTADVNQMIENAIVIFTDSNQKQTNQILNEIQMQNNRRLQSLENLYTKADNDIFDFYHMMDELNGLKEKLQMIQIFLDADDEKHMYKDLSTLMNQINTFEGAKQLGATRSWMTRFCKKWTSAMLCLDLLSMYVSIASVRDNTFLDLAAAIKRSDHCDADILSLQIIKTLQFRQKRDSLFLKSLILNTKSDTAECFISCYIEETYRGIITTNSSVPGIKNTILHGATYDASIGPFICGYLSAVSNFECNYNNIAFCTECYEKIECSSGYFKQAIPFVLTLATVDHSTSGDTASPSFSHSQCVPCECNVEGTIDGRDTCNEEGHCLCDSKYNGTKCDQCIKHDVENCMTGKCLDGLFQEGTTGCQPCGCHVVGSMNQLCDKTTGQCRCKTGYEKKKCNTCSSGYYQIFGLCLPCTGCDKDLSINGNDCNPDGSCKCKDNVHGNKCHTCKSGFYKYGSGSTSSCRPCECDENGSTSKNCDSAGVCNCKLSSVGKKCDRCNPENAYTHDRKCEFCHCYSAGTDGSQVCDKSGKCDCVDPYLNVDGINNKCRLMKGFTQIDILFGSNAGNEGYYIELFNKRGQSCRTNNINMNHKNKWESYGKSIEGGCKNWILDCNWLGLKIAPTSSGWWDGVTIGAVKVHFGKTIFPITFSKYLYFGGTDLKTRTFYISCKEGCEEGFPSCSNRHREITTIWKYPGPYDIPLPTEEHNNITRHVAEKKNEF